MYEITVFASVGLNLTHFRLSVGSTNPVTQAAIRDQRERGLIGPILGHETTRIPFIRTGGVLSYKFKVWFRESHHSLEVNRQYRRRDLLKHISVYRKPSNKLRILISAAKSARRSL